MPVTFVRKKLYGCACWNFSVTFCGDLPLKYGAFKLDVPPATSATDPWLNVSLEDEGEAEVSFAFFAGPGELSL